MGKKIELGDLLVKPAGEKGNGVFAKRAFGRGERISVSPVLVLASKDSYTLDDTALNHYQFHWPFTEEGRYDGESESSAVAWGVASLYNHDEDPNSDWRCNSRSKTISHYALRDIAAGEEITVFYGNGLEHEFVKDEAMTISTDALETAAPLAADAYTWYKWDGAKPLIVTSPRTGKRSMVGAGEKFGLRTASSAKDKGKMRLVIGDALTKVFSIPEAKGKSIIASSKKMRNTGNMNISNKPAGKGTVTDKLKGAGAAKANGPIRDYHEDHITPVYNDFNNGKYDKAIVKAVLADLKGSRKTGLKAGPIKVSRPKQDRRFLEVPVSGFLDLSYGAEVNEHSVINAIDTDIIEVSKVQVDLHLGDKPVLLITVEIA